MEVAFREKNKTEILRILDERIGKDLECEDALHRACENGWLDVAKILLNTFNLNPDGSDFWKTKLRPIHVAARAGQVELISFLLANGAPVDSEDANGSSALHFAMQEGQWETADALVTRFNANLLKCNVHGSIPLLLGLEKALQVDDSSINFHTLLQLYNNYLLPCTIPYYIVKEIYEKNWTDELLYLLQIDRDKLKQGSTVKHTSLILIVAMSGHVELLTFLLKHDADLMVTDEYGNTALLLAISEGHFDCVKTILEKAPGLAAVLNDKGEGPVRFAVRTRSPEMVYCLVDAGAEPDQEDIEGNTPLLSALRQNSRGIAEYLVKELNCDLGHVNKKGDTPLSMELTSSLYERSVIRALWLLSLAVIGNREQRGSNKLIPKDALYMACQQGLIQVVDALIQIHHCDPLLITSSGMSPFHIIVKSNDIDILGHLLAYKSCPPQLATKSGQTIASYSKPYPEVTKMLALGETRNVCFARKPIKIFVIGDPSSGKSSLAHAIKVSTKGTLKRGSLRRRKPTLGIKMRKLELPECGSVILYDCSGYVCTRQTSVLRKLVQGSPNGALFIIVTDITRKKEEVTENVTFWTSYINSISFVTSYVIVVGSHADQTSMSMWGFQNSSSISERCPNLVAGGGVMMDCRKVTSQSLSNLLTIIAQSCASLRATATILHFQHLVLYHYLCEKLSTNIYIYESKLCQIISTDIEYNTLLKDETIHESLSLLSNSGLVFCLPDEDKDQLVILQPHLLLSKVLGAVSLHNDRPLSINDAGMIEEQLIVEKFPKLNPQIILLFLHHFNLAIPTPLTNNTKPHLFIPSAIMNTERFSNSTCLGSNDCYQFGWQVQLVASQEDDQTLHYPVDIMHMLQMKLINNCDCITEVLVPTANNSPALEMPTNEGASNNEIATENSGNEIEILNSEDSIHNETTTTAAAAHTEIPTNESLIKTVQVTTMEGATEKQIDERYVSNDATTKEISNNESLAITATTTTSITTELPYKEVGWSKSKIKTSVSKGTCNIWKNGLYCAIDDVHTTVELQADVITLLMSCPPGVEMKLVKQRSSFTRLIRTIKSTCCNSNYNENEVVIAPFQLSASPLTQSLSELITYDASSIIDAISNKSESISVESGHSTSIKNLLYFDAYRSFPIYNPTSSLNNDSLLETLIAHSSLAQNDVDFNTIGCDLLNLPQEIVSEITTRRDSQATSPDSILLDLFKRWAQDIQSPLKDTIRILLDQYSIFTYEDFINNTTGQNEVTSL